LVPGSESGSSCVLWCLSELTFPSNSIFERNNYMLILWSDSLKFSSNLLLTLDLFFIKLNLENHRSIVGVKERTVRSQP
jgi:hypothetical protein